MNLASYSGARAAAAWRVALALVVLPLVLSACHMLALVPVKPDSPVVVAAGFQVAPPRGEHWFMYHHPPTGFVTFSKEDPAKYSLPGGDQLECGLEIKAEKFRQFDLSTEAGLKAACLFTLIDPDPRYKNDPPHMVACALLGTDCIRYSLSRQENTTVEGKPVVMRSDIQGYFFRHPSCPILGVNATLGERRLLETPTMLTDALKAEAEQVMRSIRFLPVDPRQL